MLGYEASGLFVRERPKNGPDMRSDLSRYDERCFARSRYSLFSAASCIEVL